MNRSLLLYRINRTKRNIGYSKEYARVFSEALEKGDEKAAPDAVFWTWAAKAWGRYLEVLEEAEKRVDALAAVRLSTFKSALEAARDYHIETENSEKAAFALTRIYELDRILQENTCIPTPEN